MNVRRFAFCAAIALVCAGWARADISIPPATPYFYIQLTGWGSGEQFDVEGSSSVSETEGFSRNFFCPSYFFESDPGARLNGGGDATGFNSNTGATLTADDNGNVTMDYVNVGPNLETVTLTTFISGPQLNELYTCSSNVFQFCGFAIVDPDNTYELEVLFTNPYHPGGIPSLPEPREYFLLLIATAACIVVARRRQRDAHRAISQRSGQAAS